MTSASLSSMLAMLLLAGCLGAVEVSTPLALEGVPSLPRAQTPWTSLLCEGDIALPREGPHEGCNFHMNPKSGPAYEASIAVNPTDPMNLVAGAKDMTLGEDGSCGKFNVWSGVYSSRDAGRTWRSGLLPGHSGDERSTPLSDYECGSDPVVAFSPEGVAYYVSLMYNDAKASPHPLLGPFLTEQTRSAIAISRSVDGGETWDDATLIQARNGSTLDKQWVAVDPANGRIHVSYYDRSGLSVVRSADGGYTWSEPLALVQAEGSLLDGPLAAQFAQVAVSAPNVVHFVWYAIRGDIEPRAEIWSRTSTDGGESWGDPVLVGDAWIPLEPGVTRKFRTTYMPALAGDPASGRAYVAWPFARSLHVAASDDGGATWSRARVTDVMLPQNDPWLAAIAVAPDGTVHATWLDYRDDPTGQAMRLYHAHSSDGGATWSKNAALGEVGFDGTGGTHQSGAGTVGDYMGLAASASGVHAVWADTREGRNDLFHAAVLG